MFELLGAIIGAIGMYIVAKQNNESNADIMSQQQEYNERMMDKQNEYDTPANQVKRAQEAGINPVTAMMSGGNIFHGNRSASALPSTAIPSINPMEGFGQTFAQLMSGFGTHQENLDKKTFREARLDQIYEETNNLRANTKLIGANAVAQDIANQYAHAREQWALNGEKSKVFLNYAQVSRFNADVKKMTYELENILPEEVKKLQSESGLNVLRQDEVIASIASIYKDIDVKDSQIELNHALSQQAESSAHNLEAQTEGQQLENSRYNEITDKYLEKYSAEIKKLAADTEVSIEEAYWKVFDLENQVQNGKNAFNWSYKNDISKGIRAWESERVKNNRSAAQRITSNKKHLFY